MALTIETLRTQVAPMESKYVCKLRSIVHNYSWDSYNLSCNPNPVTIDFINQHRNLFEIKGNHEVNTILSKSQNSNAIAYLEKNPENIVIHALFGNPAITQKLLDTVIDNYPPHNLVNYYAYLASNPSDVAVSYLLEHPDKIDWMYFSENSNPRAIALLRDNIDKINWFYLSCNESDEAIELLESYPDKICYDLLSSNSTPRAFELLIKCPENIYHRRMCANKNPKAVAYLIKHRDSLQLDWYKLSENPAAIEYLEAHPDNIVLSTFLTNPAIFELNYQAICEEKSQKMNLKEQLMMVALHPDRIDRLVKQGLSREEIIDNL